MPLDEGFVSQVPEEIRNEASFQEAAKGDVGSFAKSYVEAQKSLGRALFLPEENLKPEERQQKLNAVYDKLGRPKTHADYKVEVPEKLPPGIQWGEDRQGRVFQRLHAMGLNNEQVNGVVQTYFEEAGMDVELLTPEGGSAALKEEWKGNYEANVGAAKKAMAKWGDEEFVAWGEHSGVFNFPPFVKFMSKLGNEILREDTSKKNEGSSRMIDRDAAQERVSQILNNKEHPYHAKGRPGHQQAVDEMLRLNEIIHGGEVVSVVG